MCMSYHILLLISSTESCVRTDTTYMEEVLVYRKFTAHILGNNLVILYKIH